MIRMFTHPGFLIDLSNKTMCDVVYKNVGKYLTRAAVNLHCLQVWAAAKLSYPSVSADSVLIVIISEYCDQIEELNQRLDQAKKRTNSFSGINQGIPIHLQYSWHWPAQSGLVVRLFRGFTPLQ